MRDGNFKRRLPPGSGADDSLMADIARAFNEVADRNSNLAAELRRVRRTVGRDGHLEERLDGQGATGSWATAFDDANSLVDDLVRPTAEVARVMAAVAEGDLSQRIELRGRDVPLRGEFLRIGSTVNGIVDQLSLFNEEVTRVAREVGTEGKLGGQAKVRGVSGSWKDLTDSVNSMASRLTAQVRDIGLVTTAVANGDLSRKVTVDVQGEVLELKQTVNRMVDQLSSFADEVTRVAREVGTDGRLGGQADVKGVSGTWRDLTDSVNVMASNLTDQVRGISSVAQSVASGDLSKKIMVTARGEVAELAETINTMTDTLGSFAAEVTRVAREVGTDGKLGGQAQVAGVSGTWKDLTESVNWMATNLTNQVRDIAQVTTAVANGDLSRKITVDVKGELFELKTTINTMVDQLSSFADEVTRVAREVGTDGKLGGQAQVTGVSGTWKDLTDSVNFMAGSLTGQVRNIAQVTTAVARGDLSQKITVDVKGELFELKSTINTMVDQLSSFASEVTRVAREVGGEGRLGGQAQVPGVSGTWRDLTDSVNFMAGSLTSQVRNIAQVTTAVAGGDLSQKITVDARGEILELKSTINTMVDQLSSFAAEVTRVAREVGSEGKLGGQAQVPGVSGTWKDLTDNVNGMASNLTGQVRSIAQVSTAVARGDLSQKITVETKGEVAELAETINTMVDTLRAFADEVTRVAREVGTEGRLGGQADVQGVAGTWKDLTDNVNGMAVNLTDQVRNIAQVTTAVARGDLTQKITVDARGEILELKTTVNTMVDQLSAFADEVTRVAREVGTEGILGGQALVRGAAGTWKDLTDNVNSMALNLTGQVRTIATVSTAVARGDLSQKISVEARGEVAALAQTINTMVDTLRAFADEVTRVAREVGTEGILGGQAQVPNVAGTWKDLTDNVNGMAYNLTSQVRSIANVTTAVANGDLTQKSYVDARGEILELKNTINTMVDQLSSFAAEVTRVAREVGTEGRLGGQAEVEGVSGTWKKLTENVNQLASTLTNQLRAIAEVSTAVTRGDLTRQIAVEASGEVAELKDNINQMIANLRETTLANEEQDWLKSNLARITGLVQGRRDLLEVTDLIMRELTPSVSAQHGAFFLSEGEGEDAELRLLATYGYKARKTVSNHFKMGEALVGQAALERKPILISQAPADYIKVTSGLGESSPVNVIVLPVLFEGGVLGVIELGSLSPFTPVHVAFLDQLMELIGVSLNAILASSRTEELLGESQRLATELQEKQEELQAQQEELQQSNSELEQQAASLKASEELLQTQQEELQQSNSELEEKAALLAEQNQAIETKNSEIEQARRSLEERAEQLALSSKYKSEFLANMSHELRTPLNSLLILARLLSDNTDGNLTGKQVDFARTIHNAGADLLQLINDILDLSKVEAGKMDVHYGDVPIPSIVEYVEATFRPLTAEKSLGFSLAVSPGVPAAIHTDEHRLQQVLRNLVSNAVKFTEAGEVRLAVELAGNVHFLDAGLENRDDIIAFTVSDTGVGIPEEKLRVIFEAFQQADGTTSRRFGGTGLGLSISREIAQLLGGEIHATSRVGEGSTFTLFIPVNAFAGRRAVSVSTAVAAGTSGEPGSAEAGDPEHTARSATGTRELMSGDPSGASIPVPSGPRDEMVVAGPPVAPALLGDIDIEDDRLDLQQGDRILLVALSDVAMAGLAVAEARRRGFKAVAALEPDRALVATRELSPDAVILGLDQVTSKGTSLLDALKHTPATRHIPVHVVEVPTDAAKGEGADGADGTAEDAEDAEARRRRAMQAGALAVLPSPLTAEGLAEGLAEMSSFLDRRVRRLLVVEDDEVERRAIADLVGAGEGVEVVGVANGAEAVAALDAERFDCMVLDLKLRGMSGFTLLERLKKRDDLRSLPVIVYTGKELTRKEETRLRRYAETIIVKDARSPERLLDETALFLHRVEAELPASRRRMIEHLRDDDAVFADRRILIVDDDVRNVFALTSALERRGMTVVYAENGREGLETLQANPDVDLVLMDIMMPEMDGYATTEAIRGMERFARLPVIALTAKAMKGDREKSIAAGASDYVTKPVDLDQLLSLMRVWLYR
ncbi:MAG: HAMP domain-containing protein [Actinomycetes bacterium]